MTKRDKRYLSSNMFYKGKDVKIVTGNTMSDDEIKTASDLLKEFEEAREEEQRNIDKAFQDLRDEFYKAIGLEKIVKYIQRKLDERGRE